MCILPLPGNVIILQLLEVMSIHFHYNPGENTKCFKMTPIALYKGMVHFENTQCYMDIHSPYFRNHKVYVPLKVIITIN